MNPGQAAKLRYTECEIGPKSVREVIEMVKTAENDAVTVILET